MPLVIPQADGGVMVMRRSQRCGWWAACAVLALVLAAAGCSSGSPSATGSASAAARLDAGPAAATAVAPIHISVTGLPASGLVTVQARTTDDQGRPWESAAVFRASGTGTLNLASAVPASGSYHAADVAGLLWSLHPAFATSPDAAFVASRAGFTVRLTVLAGGHARASATLKRQLTATASTQTVAQDGFAATFSAGSAATITSEIERTPGHAPVTNLYYPGAGHYYFGKPPYYPYFANASLGGTPQANALATEQFWTHMITFLNHLPARQT